MRTYPREESDTSLSMLDGMRRGDSAAWERFVTIFGGLLYDRLRFKGHSAEDSEDMVQEVFSKVQTSFRTFVRDGKEKLFRKWMNRVVDSVTIDFVRKRRRQVQAGGGDAQARMEQVPDPIEGLVETEDDRVMLLIRTLETIKADFSPQVWQGFWMMRIEGKTSTETAEALGTTPGAVRIGTHRVDQRLKQELRGMMD